MAAFAFDTLRNNFWGSGTRIDFDTDTIYVIFVDHGVDTPLVTDDFMDDMTGAFVNAFTSRSQILSPVIGTPTVGTIDAADTVFTSLTGSSAESLVLFKYVSSEANSVPMLRWDSTSATGLPLTPNGANVTVAWNASGIATIG